MADAAHQPDPSPPAGAEAIYLIGDRENILNISIDGNFSYNQIAGFYLSFPPAYAAIDVNFMPL